MIDVPLFGALPPARSLELPAEAHEAARRGRALEGLSNTLTSGPDARMIEAFERAENPEDPFELRDLWLSRIENELGGIGRHPDRLERWRRSRRRRSLAEQDILGSRATVRFVKELFNTYFRDELFGDLRIDDLIPLSGGAVDEVQWGLPVALKDCLRFALDRNWYGYSDSRGRTSAREAVAAYENGRIDGGGYTGDDVALTMGATFAISSLCDFLLGTPPSDAAPSLCAIPNYPPLVESVARRGGVRLVALDMQDGATSLRPLIDALTPSTPLVLLQTVTNPTGTRVVEEELAELVSRASPATMIILDECHEWLGPMRIASRLRQSDNVIRVSSISKTWSSPGLKVGWFLASRAFIDEYYEFASTTFGGPPSYFYTLVEMLARMERWLEEGLSEPGQAELAEFGSGYGLTLDALRCGFASYRAERLKRTHVLSELRDATLEGLAGAGAVSLPPRYSINLATAFPGFDDSYLGFRHILHDSRVSVFPGILTFCLAGGVCRVTSARGWADLHGALGRLRDRADVLRRTVS